MVCAERLYHFMELPVENAYKKYCEEWNEEEEKVEGEVIPDGRI